LQQTSSSSLYAISRLSGKLLPRDASDGSQKSRRIRLFSTGSGWIRASQICAKPPRLGSESSGSGSKGIGSPDLYPNQYPWMLGILRYPHGLADMPLTAVGYPLYQKHSYVRLYQRIQGQLLSLLGVSLFFWPAIQNNVVMNLKFLRTDLSGVALVFHLLSSLTKRKLKMIDCYAARLLTSQSGKRYIIVGLRAIQCPERLFETPLIREFTLS